MSTKGVADIIFCLDASSSMQPCFDAVRTHISEFVAGLESNQQTKWDWRLDFVAHCASEHSDGFTVFRHQSLYNEELSGPLYWKKGQGGRFFTTNLNEFREGLGRVQVQGDEAPLVALDFCLDFPWRDEKNCHRIVIVMTDEPFETGASQKMQGEHLPMLIDKIQRLRVMLFIVAPESQVFDELASVDKSEYEVVDDTGNGLSRVDFKKILSYIGKSLSVQTTQFSKAESVPRGLFGQENWGNTDRQITGR